MKEFKPTHILHYPEKSTLWRMFPKGVPVVLKEIDEDGYYVWDADSEGNNGGYTLGDHTDKRQGLSYVTLI